MFQKGVGSQYNDFLSVTIYLSIHCKCYLTTKLNLAWIAIRIKSYANYLSYNVLFLKMMPTNYSI